MSFLKFWGKKDKKDEGDARNEDTGPVDPETEKRRLRHSLSISRSGRFKQKKRERGQILDKPEIFDEQQQQQQQQSRPERVAMATHNQNNIGQYGAGSPSHKSPSPQSTCREVNSSMARGRLRMGPSVVT